MQDALRCLRRLVVIGRVKDRLRQIAPSLPAGVKVVTAYDRSELIERSIDTLRGKLVEGMIVVLLVNLSTHTPGALYQAFPPEEARRILRRLEFHFVPKHASWWSPRTAPQLPMTPPKNILHTITDLQRAGPLTRTRRCLHRQFDAQVSDAQALFR